MQEAQPSFEQRQAAAERALLHAARQRPQHAYEAARSQAASLHASEQVMQEADGAWQERERAAQAALEAAIAASSFDVQAYECACAQVRVQSLTCHIQACCFHAERGCVA